VVSLDAEEILLLREEPTSAVSEWSSASRVCLRTRRVEISDGLSFIAVLAFLMEDLEAMVEFWKSQFIGNQKDGYALRHSRSGGCQSVPGSREPIGFITVGYYLWVV
jgi:hypothetical protein